MGLSNLPIDYEAAEKAGCLIAIVGFIVVGLIVWSIL
jgi:hypothetical protein